MSAPLSIRFDPEVLGRLRSRVASIPGATPSGLAQRLVDEGLRMAEHPGVVFRDGPAGRRPSLIVGPDIWELVTFLSTIDERGAAAVSAAAEVFAVPESAIEVGIAYYGAYPAEIDAWVAESETASARAEREWERRETLLS